MNRFELLIEKYGPYQDSDDSNHHFNSSSANKLQFALINYRLSVRDGYPIVIPHMSFLFIGSAGCAYNLENLLQTGITHIICLSSIVKLSFPERFQYHRILISDNLNENILPCLEKCCEVIETVRRSCGRVLVHCYQGKSRCVAIACGYLMKYYSYSLGNALTLVRSVRDIAQPNESFMNQLENLQQ